jgi:hypothetical protein
MLFRPSPTKKRPGLIEPCIPTLASRPPMGAQWVHEIKHDGYRLIARKQDDRVRLFTRRGYDWTDRYPRIVEAVSAVRTSSATIDGEAGRRGSAHPCKNREEDSLSGPGSPRPGQRTGEENGGIAARDRRRLSAPHPTKRKSAPRLLDLQARSYPLVPFFHQEQTADTIQKPARIDDIGRIALPGRHLPVRNVVSERGTRLDVEDAI